MRQSELEQYIQELNDKMTDIISRNFDGDNDTRLMLDKLFKNLAKYNAERMSELKVEVKSSIQEKDYCDVRIITALSETNNNCIPSFFPIAEPSEFFLDSESRKPSTVLGAFFKCPYKRFVEITDSSTFDREYQAVLKKGNDSISIPCRLKANDTFVRKEALLHKIAYQYGIESPLIFSPYSRRFALVVFDDPNFRVSDSDMICIPELDNEIEAFSNQKTLYWNIKAVFRSVPDIKADINEFIISKMTSDDADYDTNEYIIPGRQYLHKDIYKCKSNEFILFNGIGQERLGLSRQLSEERLYVLYDTNSKIEPTAKATVYSPDEIELLKLSQYFENTFSKAMFKKNRLRTIADVQYILSGFRDNPYGINIEEDIVFESDPSSALDDYNDDFRYYKYVPPSAIKENVERTIPQKRCSFCCISFNGDFVFTEDYARYVLSYLNEHYPEILWIGRCN